MPKPAKYLLFAIFFPPCFVYGQDSESIQDFLVGTWKMEPREHRGNHVATYWGESTMVIKERMPDGRYSTMIRVHKRVVADDEGYFDIPGCEGKKVCIYDRASEGIGSSFRSAFYIDYFAENWIDDLFTINGNVMTADDGNGPIVFKKVE